MAEHRTSKDQPDRRGAIVKHDGRTAISCRICLYLPAAAYEFVQQGKQEHRGFDAQLADASLWPLLPRFVFG